MVQVQQQLQAHKGQHMHDEEKARRLGVSADKMRDPLQRPRGKRRLDLVTSSKRLEPHRYSANNLCAHCRHH